MTFSPLRRVGAVICVLMLVAAACGSDSDDAASPAPATTAATATTAAPAAATTAAPAADAADAATAASFECGTGGDLQEASLLLPFPFAVPFFSVFVADSLGYFEEAGLDVSIEFTDGSAAVVQQVIAGNVDFGMSDPGPVIDATALGEDLKVPYVFQTGLIYGLVTEAGSPYTSISDFVGETVAVSEATAGEVPFFEALLASNGVDPESDVQIVETGAGATTAAAFSSDRIVAYFSDYFNLIELGFEVDLHSFDLGDFALLHAASVVATDETISEDPNLVACLSRAMARATEFTHANPTGALVAIASKHPDQVGDFSDTGFDMLALKETILRTNAYPGSSGQWGWNRPASWDHYVDLLSARGALSAEVDSNSLYTNDFIEFANDFDKNAEHAAADALAATLGISTAAAAGVECGVLIAAVPEDFDAVDPHIGSGETPATWLSLIYETLVGVDVNAGVTDSLAASWEISDDGMTYTFTLRDDVKFHNGEKFDSSHVKFSLERIINPDTAAVSGSVLSVITSIETPDAGTVVLGLDAPSGPLLNDLAQQGRAAIIHPDSIGADGQLASHNGTGPFSFVSYSAADRMVMAGNSDYWDGAPLLEGIEVRILPDNAARLAALASGEIDFAWGVPAEDAETLSQDGSFTIQENPQNRANFFSINVTRAPFDNPLVREAMWLAISRTDIAEAGWNGFAVPTLQPFAESSFWYLDKDLRVDADIARATAMIEEAGATGTEVTIVQWDALGSDLEPQIVASAWNEIGLDAKIQKTDIGTLVGFAREDPLNFDVVYLWVGLITDPNRPFSFLESDSSRNGLVGGLKSDDIDRLVEAGRTTSDPDARLALYDEAAQINLDAYAQFFTVRPFQFVGVGEDVTGFQQGSYYVQYRGGGMSSACVPG
jgi:peptide/nickel transport system substrate-binding protein